MSSIGVLDVRFHLDGCRSLKERRSRLGGLRERFGRQPAIALCEVPGDDPAWSDWTFVVVGTSRSGVTERLAGIERDLETHVDAVVVDQQRELL